MCTLCHDLKKGKCCRTVKFDFPYHTYFCSRLLIRAPNVIIESACTYSTTSCLQYCLLPTTCYYLLPTTRLLPTTYYPLPTTYYLLPTTYYLLPTTYYLLPTTYYLLPTTYYLLRYLLYLPTTYCTVPTTYYLLPTTVQYILYYCTYYLLPTTYYLLPSTVASTDRRRLQLGSWPSLLGRVPPLGLILDSNANNDI